MNLARFGFYVTVLFFLVDYGLVHQLLPFLKAFKLGILSQTILLFLVPIGLAQVRPMSKIMAWRILFMIAVFITAATSMNHGRAQHEVTTGMWRLIAGFLAFAAFVRTLDDLRLIRDLMIGLCAWTAVFVIQHGGHGPGMLEDENDVAMALIVILPFTFLSVASQPKKWKRYFYLGTFGLTLMAIAATISRGGMVGTLPTIMFLWARSKKKALSLVGLVVLVIVAILAAPPNFIHEFESIKDTDKGTAATRIFFWGLSRQLFWARPIVGVGPNCWETGVWSGIIPIPNQVSNLTPHSVYFQLISEMGLTGAIPWAGLVLSTMLTPFTMRRKKLDRDTAPLLEPFSKRPIELKQLLADKAFVDAFGTSIVISVIGFLLASTFLSVLFYPQLFVIAALSHCLKKAWDKQVAVAYVMSGLQAPAKKKPPAKPSPPARALPARMPSLGEPA